MSYNLYSEFNIEKHKETYIDYLEVIILPNGKIVYSIPSHQEKLIKIGCEQYHLTRDEFINLCPQNMWLNSMTWLLNKTNCVAVWTNSYQGTPNRLQQRQLNNLKKAGLLIIK